MNLFPFTKVLLNYFFKYVDAFIVQSAKVEKELKSIIPNPNYDKVFHPIYDNYPNPIDIKEMLS